MLRAVRHFCKAVASIVAVLAVAANAQAGSDRPPNIVIILADDLGWGDISVNGATLISTPNIDRLAAEGIQLSAFYAGSNVCTPSRAALLTGRYPIRSGMQHVVMAHSDYGLPQSEITLARLLKDAGYATGMVGKWHLGHRDEYWPTAHGFEKFYGVAYSNDMTPFDLYHHKTIVQSPVEQRELTERYASAAEEFIAQNKNRPFFLYYAETFPHLPLSVPEGASHASEAGLYGDVVQHLDYGIGRVLAALDKAGIADNTLVIVTSDNGPWFEGDAGGWRGRKGESHEGGFRVPFIARLPGTIEAGQVSHEMAMNIDLLPTIAALAGVSVPDDRVIDGRNILGVLTNNERSPHDVLFFFDGNDIAAARDRRFRLVLSAFYRSYPIPFEKYGIPMLFDLEKDPHERFSFNREHPQILENLMSRVAQMRAEVAGLHKDPRIQLPPSDPSVPKGPILHGH